MLFFISFFGKMEKSAIFFSTNRAVGFVVWGNWPKQCDRLELFPAIILVTGFLRKRYFLCAKMGKKRGENAFFSREIGVKRAEACIFALLRHGAALHMPRVYNLHTLGVNSTHHGCTLGIPWGNIRCKRFFFGEKT